MNGTIAILRKQKVSVSILKGKKKVSGSHLVGPKQTQNDPKNEKYQKVEK